MITSSKQYKASKCAADDLRKMLLSETDSTIPEKWVEANHKKLRKKLGRIEQEIAEYEAFITLGTSTFRFDKFEDLLEIPIKYRLTNCESVKDFAHETGVSQRQILRYEEKLYHNCSIPTLLKILDRIGITISGEIKKQSRTTE